MSRRHCCGSFESKWWTLPGSSSWDSTREGRASPARRRLTTLLPRRAAGPVSRTSVSVSSSRGLGPRLTYRTSALAWPMLGSKARGSFASCARIAAAPGSALGPAAAPVGLGRPASGVLPERVRARSNSVPAVTPRLRACIASLRESHSDRAVETIYRGSRHRSRQRTPAAGLTAWARSPSVARFRPPPEDRSGC